MLEIQSLQAGQIVTGRKLRDENSMLKRRDLKPVEVRDAVPATSTRFFKVSPVLHCRLPSFMSAASFQETTKVLNEAAINGKVDRLEGMEGERNLRSPDSCRYRTTSSRRLSLAPKKSTTVCLPTRRRYYYAVDEKVGIALQRQYNSIKIEGISYKKSIPSLFYLCLFLLYCNASVCLLQCYCKTVAVACSFFRTDYYVSF